MKDRSIKISKFLSLVLRHQPETIGITLSAEGWVPRYGRPIVLKIATERMNRDGHLFFRSANGVWLTDHVPVDYIEFQGDE